MRTRSRRAVRTVLIAVVLTTVVGGGLSLAGPAAASAPDTWPDPDALPLLQALLLFVGVPLGLVLVISLLAAGPSIARGARERRGREGWDQPHWFGGPAEVEARPGGEPAALEGRADPEGGGGAGARW